MKPHTLLFSVAVVIVCVGASYFVLAPYAERSLSARLTSTDAIGSAVPIAAKEDEVVVDGQAIITEDNGKEVDRDDRVEVEDDRGTQSSVAVSTPKPIATPTPAPTPEPTPKPKPSGYTMADVALHASKSSCWTAINGSVYDITSYIPRHPGGEKNIMKICGKDGASLFEGQHGGDSKPESKLASLRIGALVQ